MLAFPEVCGDLVEVGCEALLIVFGALITIFAAWRYDRVNRQIEAGLVKTDRAMVWILTTLIAILSATAVVYMLMRS